MKNNLIKALIFIIILIILLKIVFHVLWLDQNDIYFFYKEPRKTIDVAYIGGSNTREHFNSTLAYNLYGYTTGIFASSGQPFYFRKYCIEEIKKSQNPSLYIIDMACFAEDLDTITTETIRKTTDALKFSKNRIDAINEALSYKKDISKKEYINYYFSFLLYHNKYKSIYEGNIFGNEGFYKGYTCSKDIKIIEPEAWSQEIENLPEEQRKILYDFINYVKSNNVNVLFVIPIRQFEETVRKRLNEAIKIIEENNLKIININTIQEFEADYNNDFRDSAHLNVYGATKYTLYFSKYLKENYNLPNHIGDSKYSSWDSEYERFKLDYKRMTGNNFDELLTEYNYEK